MTLLLVGSLGVKHVLESKGNIDLGYLRIHY